MTALFGERGRRAPEMLWVIGMLRGFASLGRWNRHLLRGARVKLVKYA